MKRLFIGSTLLLAATVFLTGCVSHAPVKSVHIVKVHSNQYLPNPTKNHHYTSHQTVKVYQTHYPKVVRYEPQHSSHHIYQQPVHKQHNGYIKTYKSIKPYKSNHQKHAYSKKKVVTNKRIVRVVKKSRPIVVNKPKNQVHHSRESDIRSQKTYKNDRPENHQKNDSRMEQKAERRSVETRKIKKLRTIQTEHTYSRR